jgi:hypothetical protein
MVVRWLLLLRTGGKVVANADSEIGCVFHHDGTGWLDRERGWRGFNGEAQASRWTRRSKQ